MPWLRGDLARSALPSLMLIGACCGCRAEGREKAVADAQVATAASSASTSSILVATPEPAPATLPIGAHVTDSELRKLAADDPAALGSLSLGEPHDGALANPVQLIDGPNWIVAYPETAWATSETAGYLKRAFGASELQDAPSAYVGDLSMQWGGPLSPHKSHQSGRDVDIGYYRLDERWWAEASAATLDAARTWALLRALITTTEVEVVFVDRSLQPLLRTHALGIGENPAWLDRLFELDRPSRRSLIRHAPEHRNHLHVRFYNPAAQRVGRVVHDLVARGVQRAPPLIVPPRCLPSTCR